MFEKKEKGERLDLEDEFRSRKSKSKLFVLVLFFSVILQNVKKSDHFEDVQTTRWGWDEDEGRYRKGVPTARVDTEKKSGQGIHRANLHQKGPRRHETRDPNRYST